MAGFDVKCSEVRVWLIPGAGEYCDGLRDWGGVVRNAVRETRHWMAVVLTPAGRGGLEDECLA
ncbi:hypothetical protein E2C01_094719 [Portunus trituberculatus]|uniref:Uncharacterized protein n=1 Tax=Portunus trituberculatus TaxID=210409 RepID=A0A5B7JXZ2_PORTR|nr:hypothetical protein [Portunus trituberculatus]